jgi:hypothetical protein
MLADDFCIYLERHHLHPNHIFLKDHMQLSRNKFDCGFEEKKSLRSLVSSAQTVLTLQVL